MLEKLTRTAAMNLAPPSAAAVSHLAEMPLTAVRLDAAMRAVSPHLTDAERSGWVAALAPAMYQSGMTAPRCAASFLGECAVESGGFRTLEENLRYGAGRLREVWPSRFPTDAAAARFAENPEALANRVYANRMGNGDEASGDGWRFRGRGLIQITGKTAYAACAKALGKTLDDDFLAWVLTAQGAAASACWYWLNAWGPRLMALSNAMETATIARLINGGETDLGQRMAAVQAVLSALTADELAPVSPTPPPQPPAPARIAGDDAATDALNQAELAGLSDGRGS